MLVCVLDIEVHMCACVCARHRGAHVCLCVLNIEVHMCACVCLCVLNIEVHMCACVWST